MPFSIPFLSGNQRGINHTGWSVPTRAQATVILQAHGYTLPQIVWTPIAASTLYALGWRISGLRCLSFLMSFTTTPGSAFFGTGTLTDVSAPISFVVAPYRKTLTVNDPDEEKSLINTASFVDNHDTYLPLIPYLWNERNLRPDFPPGFQTVEGPVARLVGGSGSLTPSEFSDQIMTYPDVYTLSHPGDPTYPTANDTSTVTVNTGGLATPQTFLFDYFQNTSAGHTAYFIAADGGQLYVFFRDLLITGSIQWELVSSFGLSCNFTVQALPGAIPSGTYNLGSVNITIDPVIASPVTIAAHAYADSVFPIASASIGSITLQADRFIPHWNRLGQPVYDTTSGAQINDPFA